MKRIIIFSILLLAAIVVMAVKYFSALNGSTSNHLKVLRLIPSNAAMVMSINNDESTYDLFKNYGPFEAVAGKTLVARMKLLRNVLLKDIAPQEASDSWKIFLSFHPTKGDSLDVMFGLALNPKFSRDKLMEAAGNNKNITIQEIDDKRYELQLGSARTKFYVYADNESLLGSFSKQLINQIDPKKSISSSFVNEINDNTLKNQNSPIGINFSNDASFKAFRLMQRGSQDGNSALLNKMQGLTALSMNFKSDALMFNGLSKPDTTQACYFNIYLRQQPVVNYLKNFIPENTANFLEFAFSDPKKFNADLNHYFLKRGEWKKIQANVNTIRKQTGLNIDRDIKHCLSNEFAVIETKNRERYVIIKLKDGIKMASGLRLVSNKLSDNISQINRRDVLYTCLGAPLQHFAIPYFAIVDNFMIVANTSGVIQNYLTAYNQGTFLSRSREFSNHEQLVANKCNVRYFVNTANSSYIIRRTLRGRYASLFDDAHALKNFYGLSVQLSADSPNFQVNVYSNYNEPADQELGEAWKLKLNASVSEVFGLFRKGLDKILLVQDKSNNLYGITEDGKKLWQESLNGKIMGAISQLDDDSFIFNTNNRLYRIDTTGTAAGNFPVAINYQASGGSVISTGHAKETKIFIPAYNLIMGFHADGTLLNGWESPLATGILNNILVGHEGNADYVMAANNGGRFYFIDMNGKVAEDLKTETSTSFRGDIYYSSPIQKNCSITCADTAGLVYQVSKGGKMGISNSSSGSIRQFAWANVTGDLKPEMIFLDKKQLSVLNSDAIPVFNYILEKNADYKLYILSADDENIIAVTAENGRKTFIFDDDGNLRKGFPVKSMGKSAIGTLRTDGGLYLFCGSENADLHAYRL